MAPRGSGWTPSRIATVALVALMLASTVLWVPVAPNHFRERTTALPGASATTALVSPNVWDNGRVRLVFPNPFPAFSVQSDQNPNLSSAHVLTGVAELTPSGNVTTYASFGGQYANWGFSSLQGPNATMIWMNATLHVFGASGSWESSDDVSEYSDANGTARVVLTFYLNGSSSPDPAAVRFTVNVTKWPWANASDSLGFGFVAVAVAGSRIVPGTVPNSLDEVSVTNHSTLATLSWASNATVRYRAGAGDTSSVGTYQAFAANGTNSTVHLRFGAVSGGYSDLSFDPWIRLNLTAFRAILSPPLPAWVFTTSTLETLGLATVVVVALAAVASRSRSRDPPPP